MTGYDFARLALSLLCAAFLVPFVIVGVMMWRAPWKRGEG